MVKMNRQESIQNNESVKRPNYFLRRLGAATILVASVFGGAYGGKMVVDKIREANETPHYDAECSTPVTGGTVFNTLNEIHDGNVNKAVYEVENTEGNDFLNFGNTHSGQLINLNKGLCEEADKKHIPTEPVVESVKN